MRKRSRGPLTLVYSAGHGNDLPPMWDGVPVIWGEWEELRSSLVWHNRWDRGRGPCTACGSTRHPHATSGRRADRAATHQPLWLFAMRCLDCMHDVVYVEPDGTSWDLDPEDYADRGSYARTS